MEVKKLTIVYAVDGAQKKEKLRGRKEKKQNKKKEGSTRSPSKGVHNWKQNSLFQELLPSKQKGGEQMKKPEKGALCKKQRTNKELQWGKMNRRYLPNSKGAQNTAINAGSPGFQILSKRQKNIVIEGES